MAHSGTTAAINGSSALKLIPLFIRRAMMPRPVAKAIPKPIVGTTSVSPLVNGINEAPSTWQMTEVATSAIMLGVNVLMFNSPTGICTSKLSVAALLAKTPAQREGTRQSKWGAGGLTALLSQGLPELEGHAVRFADSQHLRGSV